MPFQLDINFPSVLCNKAGVFLELATSIKLELPDDATAEAWKERTIIRGSGLSVGIKLLWNGHIIKNENFIEAFGRGISKSKLWAQLLFAVSLEIPSSPTKEEDIILNLIRTDLANTAWSPSAAESQIQLHLPTACLRRLSLLAFFSSMNGSHNLVEDGSLYADKLGTEEVCGTTQEGIGRGRESPFRSKDFYISGTKGHSALQFLSLVDTAFMSLLKDTLGRIAPCIFSPGYLESLWHAGQHIGSVGASFHHVHRIMKHLDSKHLSFNNPRGFESALWRLATSRLDNDTGKGNQICSLLDWDPLREEILSTLEQTFDLSGQCEQRRKLEEEPDNWEALQSPEPQNADFDDSLWQQSSVETILDNELADCSGHDLLWLEGDCGDTINDLRLSEQNIIGSLEPTLVADEEDILGEGLLLLPEDHIQVHEDEMLM